MESDSDSNLALDNKEDYIDFDEVLTHYHLQNGIKILQMIKMKY